MKSLFFYRVVSYVLLFVAGFLSLTVLTALPSAFSNPMMLLILFGLSCIIIYSYTSWRFLTRGIENRLPCKPSLRDLIRVNSYFSIILAILFLFPGIFLLLQPTLAAEAAEQAMSNMPPGVDYTKKEMQQAILSMGRFLLIYGLLLLIHIVITYRLLKQFRPLFKTNDAEA